ncbi:hypothetical protein FQA39_LY12044 [Lamprigera yunnana]|nr:hypothetical protein FQA39_LY12044 [Lamprigera yunnana]
MCSASDAQSDIDLDPDYVANVSDSGEDSPKARMALYAGADGFLAKTINNRQENVVKVITKRKKMSKHEIMGMGMVFMG